MKRVFFLLITVLAFFPHIDATAQGDIAILSPSAGEALQGRVVVRGYIKASNVKSYRLEFGYEKNNVDGWYLINSAINLGQDDVLGVWDTATISDGNYSLRLTVEFGDGTTSQYIVSGLRVRNYSPIEASTPSSINVIETSTPTKISLLPVEKTLKTPIENPAGVTEERYKWLITIGLVIGIILTAIFSMIIIRQRDGTS